MDTHNGDMNFMGYMVHGEIHDWANIYPPYHSTGFSVQEEIVTCDRCSKTFELKDR